MLHLCILQCSKVAVRQLNSSHLPSLFTEEPYWYSKSAFYSLFIRIHLHLKKQNSPRGW